MGEEGLDVSSFSCYLLSCFFGYAGEWCVVSEVANMDRIKLANDVTYRRYVSIH